MVLVSYAESQQTAPHNAIDLLSYNSTLTLKIYINSNYHVTAIILSLYTHEVIIRVHSYINKLWLSTIIQL